MPQCQFPIFWCFFVSEKLHRKYSWNWTTKAIVPYFSDMRQSPKHRRRGACRQAHHRVVRPTPGPRHQVVWPPGPPPDATLLPIYSPRRESLKDPINFPWNILQAAAIINARSGGSKSSSRHPTEEGNHRRRPSLSPCLPPKWWVSSLPWTTGP
jgi:hypothetical protein